MKTLLEIYCKARNWQGGTIHQILPDFRQLTLKEKDHVITEIMRQDLSVYSDNDIRLLHTLTSERLGF